ncbi:MAG: PTS sugar transporter subunit IIA [Deltaproteobacteria bacterium]|nr:PTS sugar transporter subunit IIA [Deltaproteobacteria bacterium]
MELTVTDAARLLGVSEKRIYRWIKEQAIPVYRINEQLRFHRAELLEWATARQMQISPELFAQADTGSAALPALCDALKKGGILYRIGGDDKPSVLRAVVEVLPLPEEVDREFLFGVLLAREALGSTGIGDGIAIPHVRNPIVLHVSEPTITLCFLQHPINFGAIDSQPVHTLFTLISPSVRIHHHLLSRLAFVLRDPEFRDALRRQAPAQELMETLSRAEAGLAGASDGGTAPRADAVATR